MNKKGKLWIALALIVAGALLARLAWSMYSHSWSVIFTIAGILLFWTGLVVYVIYFRE